MLIKSVQIEIADNVASISKHTTRVELQWMFGPPDDIGGFSSKMKKGAILKYGTTEFHFDGDRDGNRLVLIYREHDIAGEIVPVVSINL